MEEYKINTNNLKKLLKTMWLNFIDFLGIMIFVTVFMFLFGQSNVLAGVAVVVGFLTYPNLRMGVKAKQMSLAIFFIYAEMAIAPQLSLLNCWLGIIVNFISLCLIMILFCEPILQKPYIPVLLCYVFLQGSPSVGKDFILRAVGLLIGGGMIAFFSYRVWNKLEQDHEHIDLKQQISRCYKNNKGFIMRIVIGLILGMFLGAILKVAKPMWISIVVMSLTQPVFEDTKQRIKYRFAATFIGAILFVLIFQIIIPVQYSSVIILFFGYLTCFKFAKQYKNQQIINAMNALNASLVILDVPNAILMRISLLLVGILIVLFMFGLECKIIRPLYGLIRQKNLDNFKTDSIE